MRVALRRWAAGYLPWWRSSVPELERTGRYRSPVEDHRGPAGVAGALPRASDVLYGRQQRPLSTGWHSTPCVSDPLAGARISKTERSNYPLEDREPDPFECACRLPRCRARYGLLAVANLFSG